MPSGTLPNAGSLGDPQITTGDYQTQINQLLAYVRSLQSEVAALSGTQIKEGAVRGVGTAASELVETSILDTRLAALGPKSIYSTSYPGASFVNLSSLPTEDQVAGVFFVRANAYTDSGGTFGDYWMPLPFFDATESAAGGYFKSSAFDIGVIYDETDGRIKPWGSSSSGADYRILEIARVKP